MCMIDESEPATFHRIEQRHARRDHRCDECGGSILPHELYEIGTWFDRSNWRYARLHGMRTGTAWSTIKVCERCIVARRWLQVVCSGWLYGACEIDMREHVDEHELVASWALKLLADRMAAGWHEHGKRMPISRVRSLTHEAIRLSGVQAA